MLRSLSVKLTLAFLLVGLTGSILVTVIVQQRTRTAFNNFILNREQQALVENLIYYYQANGSWEGVADALSRVQTFSPFPPGNSNQFPEENTLTLVSADRSVVYSTGADEIGQRVSKNKLNGAAAIQINSQTVGYLILTSARRSFNTNTPEGIFLRNVNSATFLSASVAVLLALILGGLLAFTMTRSLRDLTEATVEIAKGRFGKQVKVRSQDEIGELATSFNKMSQELEQATNSRRQMTADIAHDLRSPLSVITGYAEALSDNKLPGTSEIYNILLQETKHLDHLVDDLRLLSLADTGELSLTLQPMAPYSLLERVEARHLVTAHQNKIELCIEASRDLPMILIDVERMSQVLDNLIINAFRYTPEGGRVNLGAETQGERVLLTVTDTGKGISPEDVDHVFDRFYRGDKSRQHNGESGLGLAIAKSIIEAHGGTIHVESAPGLGAKFIISLKV